MGRTRLATTGERGKLVRLFLEERLYCDVCRSSGASKKWTEAHAERCANRKLDLTKRYVVQYGPKNAREQEGFPATKAGKAEAEAFFKAFKEESKKTDDPAPPKRLMVRELWAAYVTAEAKRLRPNTLRLYTDAWRTWEQFITPSAIADDLTIQRIHEYREALDERGLATATVQDAIRNVRIVYNWGERNELLQVNKWHLFVYKVAKEKRTKPRAEYRSDEFLAIWKALNPNWRGQWRAWVAVGLLGIYGNRQNEILNLRWSWITGDDIRVDPSVVKTGEEGALTLFPLTRGILDVARRWRLEEGYTGDYVLFPGQYAGRKHPSKQPHYSIQSLTDGIHLAEKRAEVEQIKWRAGHGFRRGLVGDLVDQTGDPTLALQAIGDKDLKMLHHYRVKRRDRVDAAVQERAGRIMAPSKGATKVQPQAENGTTPSNGTGRGSARKRSRINAL